jgi:hypothetical protein
MIALMTPDKTAPFATSDGLGEAVCLEVDIGLSL